VIIGCIVIGKRSFISTHVSGSIHRVGFSRVRGAVSGTQNLELRSQKSAVLSLKK